MQLKSVAIYKLSEVGELLTLASSIILIIVLAYVYVNLSFRCLK